MYLPDKIGIHRNWRLEQWRRREMEESLGHLGAGSSLGPHVLIQAPERLSVGEHSRINDFTVITAHGGVTIGSHVLIAVGCHITTLTHSKDPVKRRTTAQIELPIRIGNGAWLGAGAIVLPGVTIGDNAIVGAGAVVTRNVAANATVIGMLAREVRPTR